jgi:hypothetical protein
MVTDNALDNGTATNSVRATVTDANGNRVSGVSVGFSASNSATIAATGTSDANGEIELTLTSTTAGTSTVTAVLGSASVTADVNFTPEPFITVAVTTNNALIVSGTNVVQVTVRSRSGAAISGATVNASASRGTADATATTNALGVATINVTSDTRGASVVTVTSGTASGTANVMFTEIAVSTLLSCTWDRQTRTISASFRFTWKSSGDLITQAWQPRIVSYMRNAAGQLAGTAINSNIDASSGVISYSTVIPYAAGEVSAATYWGRGGAINIPQELLNFEGVQDCSLPY